MPVTTNFDSFNFEDALHEAAADGTEELVLRVAHEVLQEMGDEGTGLTIAYERSSSSTEPGGELKIGGPEAAAKKLKQMVLDRFEKA